MFIGFHESVEKEVNGLDSVGFSKNYVLLSFLCEEIDVLSWQVRILAFWKMCYFKRSVLPVFSITVSASFILIHWTSQLTEEYNATI